MTTFLLVRHASHDLLGHTLAGWTPGVRLNERGRREAERLGERLSAAAVEAIYTSPLDRGVETAVVIARRLGKSPILREALGEIRFGDWTGLAFEALAHAPGWKEFNACRTANTIPGGESIQEVERRIVGELSLIRARHPSGAVVVVSHGDVLRTAVAHFLGLPLDGIDGFEIHPASISVLQVDDGGARLTALNDLGDAAPCGVPLSAAAVG